MSPEFFRFWVVLKLDTSLVRYFAVVLVWFSAPKWNIVFGLVTKLCTFWGVSWLAYSSYLVFPQCGGYDRHITTHQPTSVSFPQCEGCGIGVGDDLSFSVIARSASDEAIQKG
jgi:hypothetical protein